MHFRIYLDENVRNKIIFNRKINISMLAKFFKTFQTTDELRALFKLKMLYSQYKPDKRPLDQLAKSMDDLDFCYATLGKVSRSFSVVIRELPEELKDVVAIFYLVLRALDSIEDDTNTDEIVRFQLLKDFHEHLHCDGWNIDGVGDKKDYQILLANFEKVISCFKNLDIKYQQVISEICRQMGEGMTENLDKELYSVQEYDNYCFYVAGLVGVGLTDLFTLSGYEDQSLSDKTELSISMGLFLQKTNIIRDFHGDILEKRTFWPREIWHLYGNNLEEFVVTDSSERMHCLNHMVTNAMTHVNNCLEYLSQIKSQQIFNFCAIPQVMAIATLAEVFNNPELFSSSVKIRKGLTATLIFKTKSFENTLEIFRSMTEEIFKKTELEDPNVSNHVETLQKIKNFTLVNMDLELPVDLTKSKSNYKEKVVLS